MEAETCLECFSMKHFRLWICIFQPPCSVKSLLAGDEVICNHYKTIMMPSSNCIDLVSANWAALKRLLSIAQAKHPTRMRLPPISPGCFSNRLSLGNIYCCGPFDKSCLLRKSFFPQWKLIAVFWDRLWPCRRGSFSGYPGRTQIRTFLW